MRTRHPDYITGVSQCDLILARLIAARGEWVPMPELAAVSSAYAVHSRISDLRADGWAIPAPRHATVRRRGRQYRHTAYRLPVESYSGTTTGGAA